MQPLPTRPTYAVYLTLGSGPSITTNNTEILITDIGEDAGVVSLLSPVTLTSLPAVEVLLTTMVMEDWDSGRILMGV